MSDRIYDVAVVGGGPAGASAAAVLARAGLRTLLVEQSSGDAFKVGEGLPPAAKPLLLELGVWDRLDEDGHLKSHGNASAWGNSTLTYTQFLSDPHGYGWHLDRARFDARLREIAREAGAGIELSTDVQHITRAADGWQLTVEIGRGRATISCRWLLDCSGRRASVARLEGVTRAPHDHLVAFVTLLRADNARLKPSRSSDGPQHDDARWSAKASAERYQNDDVDSLTLVESAPDGWWYTSRVPSGRIVVYLTDARDESARQARDAGGFQWLVEETVHVRARVEAYRDAAWEPPLIVAADTSRLERVAGDRWIAAGDAALSFDPLSSQGILTAIYSGSRAARALVASGDGDPTALDEYSARLDAIFTTYLDRQREYYRLERRWLDRPFWRTRVRSA